MFEWAQETGVAWHFIARPANPPKTAYAKVLTVACTTSFSMDAIQGARSRSLQLACWIADFNQRRPHSALGYLTPAAYAAELNSTSDQLRNPDQLRRSPVAPPAHTRHSPQATQAKTG
jgi:putative transposase